MFFIQNTVKARSHTHTKRIQLAATKRGKTKLDISK